MVGRKFDLGGCDVFFQAWQLGRARDRDHPGLLGRDPGKRNLDRCQLLLPCEPAKQINQCLIGFSILRREARHDVSEIAFVDPCVFVDLNLRKPLLRGL